MSFAAFVSGVMQPTVDRYRAEQETKRRLEEHAAGAKLDKALNEWEFYSPEERAAVAPELDKILKQKKGYSADLLGKGEQGYKFLKGALDQQRPIQSLEAGAKQVASQPVNLGGKMEGPESLDAVNPGEFEKSPTPIQLPSRPVSLPPLPIEGANIPRVDSNVLQLPPSQRAAAVADYKKRQSGMLERQSKVGEIQESPLDPEDQEVAIESLYLPPGVLSARERRGLTQQIALRNEQGRMDRSGKRKFFRIPGSTPETSTVVNYIEKGGKLYDDAGNEVTLPPNSVSLDQHTVQSTDDAGNLNIVNTQAAIGPGNYRAVIEGAGRRTQPRAASAVTPPSDADVAAVAERVKSGELTASQAHQLLGGQRGGAGSRLIGAIGENRIAPPKLREQMTALRAAQGLIEPIKTMVADVQKAGMNPVERARATAILENYAGSVSGRIARAFGEVGTMNEGDIKRAKGLVPGIIAANFDPEFAKREFEWLDSLLATQQKNLSQGSFKAIPKSGGTEATGDTEQRKKSIMERLGAINK